MSGWAEPCLRCGHPAGYHGVTFCQADVGSYDKRRCDCAEYQNPERARIAAWAASLLPGSVPVVPTPSTEETTP